MKTNTMKTELAIYMKTANNLAPQLTKKMQFWDWKALNTYKINNTQYSSPLLNVIKIFFETSR